MKKDFAKYEKLLSTYAKAFEILASSSTMSMISFANTMSDYLSAVSKSVDSASSFFTLQSTLKNSNISSETVVASASAFKAMAEQYKIANSILSQSALETLSCIASNADNLKRTINLSVDALSPLVQVNLEEEDNVHIDLPEQLSEIVNAIDDTLELPQHDLNNIVRIDKTNTDKFWKVISLLVTIIGIIVPIYLDATNTKLSEQQHAESMRLEQRHHDEYIREESKQTDYLKKIAENVSPDSETIPQSSEINESPEE